MNLLCIVDEDHELWAVLADHSSEFKGMVNPQLTALEMEMEQHIPPISGKKKKKLLFELEKKESKKLCKVFKNYQSK